MTNAEHVWELYKIAKVGQTTTIRSGYGLYGIYSYDPQKPFSYDRSESDAEHVFGTIILLTHVMKFYPYLIPVDYYSTMAQCLLFHELGENVTGDIPDDGTRDDAQKSAGEFQYIKEYLTDWPAYKKNEILDLFYAMQRKETRMGRIIYFIDKAEAILQNLIYESQGRAGSFQKKLEQVGTFSERDQNEFMNTKSDKPADMWAYHFYDTCHEWEGFDVFFDIIRAAVRDVRGEDFRWLFT